MNNYRSITKEEIDQLIQQRCQSDEWDKLYIKPTTDLSKITSVTFSGENYLGSIEGSRTFYGGIVKQNSIKNVHLHNCRIGDNAFINNVKSYIANYHIGDNVLIDNVDIIAVDGACSFGNGVTVDVINEGGGRDILIFNQLSAQIAYLLALYRHKTVLVDELKRMIEEYTKSITSTVGYIGNDVKILNANTIKGVCIGDGAYINSASKLINGSINSTSESQVYVGTGVMATNFIISSDSKVDNSSVLTNCFIGQGCLIDKHYSIEHSIFFANCQGFNGEACSIFAGPYTVTHHKSTLLIAGLFSFMNAGSGSNQSNHMYKLGPIHQGIMERGAKTTSDSYVLWPSKIGPFTLVMGRHYQHVDSSDFPFSYLIEDKNKSYLIPGANLKSVGTVRDAQKWPKRDNRHQKNRMDIINFNLLSPYTIHKVSEGLKYLNTILELSGDKLEEYNYKDMVVKKSSLHNGIKMYNIVINKFLGNSIISRVEDKNIKTIDELRKILKPTSSIGKGKWIDVSGLLCPISALNLFVDKVEKLEVKTIEDVIDELNQINNHYYEYEWNWAVELIESFYKIKIEEITQEDFINIVNDWRKSVVDLDKMLYKDASKEFDLHSYVGFGADGDEKEKLADFKSVRGAFESNSTVLEILSHIDRKEKLGAKIIAQIKEIKG
ncbi:DUF4954 family protein [Wenyingzhuangia marina]|uniref:DUF4954 domain-containing protein n=1 Tax=Wenyingzhuangia marina TaxID=1195760 RepID=A0A1M5VKJ3_9FLAO|nr:DUF4954 family protein [Wenyingzhuangia marina]GGF71749.1 DUF4954 domain-containing protein [Wenyingzhuangia marina]SHH75443.1 protein of unknown function [Wenyingzhuangia marina]